ncbi:MAG: tetratricopeptide repeat protein [Coprobacillus sp.]|nr:tetratricopeptide repeat protein [Coprobacillus sp.]
MNNLNELKISLTSFGKRERIRMSSLSSFLREFSLTLKKVEGYTLTPFIEEASRINEYTLRGNDINVWIFFTYFNKEALNEFLEMKKDAEKESSTKVIMLTMDGIDLNLEANDYIVFDNLDTLKLRMVEYLCAYLNLNIYSLSVSDYDLVFDSLPIEGINLDYVMEFNSNRALQYALEDFEARKDVYRRYVSSFSSPDKIDVKKANELGFNYSGLLKNIKEKRQMILTSSLRMVYAKYHKMINSETDKGYYLLFKGQLFDSAKKIDLQEIVRKVPLISSVKEGEEFIVNTLFNLDSLVLSSSYTVEEVETLLKASLNVCLRYHIRGDVAFAYIDYISQTYLASKVISLVQSSLPDILACDYFSSPYEIALLYYLMADVYQDNQEKNLSIKFYSLSVSILEDIVKENPDKYLDILSSIYLEYGTYLVEVDEYDRAVTLLNNASKTLSPYLDLNPKLYKERMALYFFYLGNAYYDMYDLKKALSNYKKALSYIDHYSEDVVVLLEDTITSFVTISMELNEFSDVESLLLDLLKLDKLFYSYDPVNFEYDISEVYQLLGTYYAHENKGDKALYYYQEAFKKREKLIEINPSLFGVGYSVTCVGLATAYLERGEREKTIDYLEEGRDVLEPLYNVKPYEVGNELSSIYLDLGSTYISFKDYPRAESSYLRAIEIQERFAGGKASPNVALMYYNLGVLYEKMEEDKKSEQAYRRGLKNLEGYNETNFPQYDMVIDSLNNALDKILKKLSDPMFGSLSENAA